MNIKILIIGILLVMFGFIFVSEENRSLRNQISELEGWYENPIVSFCNQTVKNVGFAFPSNGFNGTTWFIHWENSTYGILYSMTKDSEWKNE